MQAAAQGLSTYGYANLILERVASEAGYTRGALYHQFAGKEDLALAVVDWIDETWRSEVGYLLQGGIDPVQTLLAVARGHAVYCRRDVARVLMTLRVEFTGQNHPVGRAISENVDSLTADCADLIAAARAGGGIPQGPPPQETARAYLSVLEAVVIELAGESPYDIEFAERAVRGVLGLPSPA